MTMMLIFFMIIPSFVAMKPLPTNGISPLSLAAGHPTQPLPERWPALCSTTAGATHSRLSTLTPRMINVLSELRKVCHFCFANGVSALIQKCRILDPTTLVMATIHLMRSFRRPRRPREVCPFYHFYFFILECTTLLRREGKREMCVTPLSSKMRFPHKLRH